MQQAELRSLLGSFVACSFGSLLLLSPHWTSEAALAPTLVAGLSGLGLRAFEAVAWPLALAAVTCGLRIQQRTVAADDRRDRGDRDGALVTPGGAAVHLVSMVTSAALITPLPAYSLTSSALLVTILVLITKGENGPERCSGAVGSDVQRQQHGIGMRNG